MKIAVTGKGGVGKSSITAALALLAAREGTGVLAIDADPDANLAHALGVPRSLQAQIRTIAHAKELIEERTGARIQEYGQMFKLNPEVADIADRYALEHRGVKLVVLGAVEGGGAGCACPESTLLRALVSDLVLRRDEYLFMDMEAGVEHLGRATVQGVGALLVVVEPGLRSLDTARRIIAMAADIGLRRVVLVANKVRSADDEAFIREAMPNAPLLGVIPFSDRLMSGDRDGRSVLDGADEGITERLTALLASLRKYHLTPAAGGDGL